MEDQTNKNASQQQGASLTIQIPSPSQMAAKRSLIPLSFTVVIICFFLAFCDFRCSGQTFATITGINMVTGTTLNLSGMSGAGTGNQALPSSFWAVIALCAAIVGVFVFLIREKREAMVGVWTGIIGFASLLILQFVIRGEVQRQGQGLVEVDFDLGYWLALVAFAVASLLSYFRYVAVRTIPVSSALPSSGKNELASGQPISEAKRAVSVPSRQFDAMVWLRKYMYWIGGAAAIALLSYGIYYFFIRHDDLVADVNTALSDKYGTAYHVVTDMDINWDKYDLDNFVKPGRKKSEYYPYVVKGDFDGDGTSDLAAVVKNTANGMVQLAIVWGGDKGIQFYNGQICPVISLVTPKEFKSHWQSTPLNLRTDAILVECYEKSAWILYWNGYSFQQYWLSD